MAFTHTLEMSLKYYIYKPVCMPFVHNYTFYWPSSYTTNALRVDGEDGMELQSGRLKLCQN